MGGLRSVRAACVALLIVAFPVAATTAETGSLFEDDSILPLTLRAPMTTLFTQAEQHAEVDGTLALEDGTGFPVRITTFGNSRLRECKFLPMKMTAALDATEGTPFEGISTLRVIPHCSDSPDLERYMVIEYLAYKSYALLAEPALRVRLVRFTYTDTDRRDRVSSAHAFFVEDIGAAAERSGLTWATVETLKVGDLDPTHTAFLTLFQYMIGNTDWSALRGPPGERCCHNIAVLTSETGDRLRLLPFDFDQSGLVDAPYAVPAEILRIGRVTQRRFRGYCVHNDQLPATIEIFNQHRTELEALFSDDALPHERSRTKALKYLDRFYEEINDSKKLQKKILGACR